jgi:methyl-accepting chemotaxis protein
LVERLPAGGRAPGADRQSELAAAVALLRFQTDGLEADLNTAFAETKNFNKREELEPALSPLLARALDDTALVAELTGPTVDQTAYRAAVRKAVDANKALWSALLDQEDAMLRSREEGDLDRRRFALTAVFVALLASLLLMSWVARRISRSVGAVAAAAEQLEAGNLSSRARVRSRDEVGVMASAFNAMAESLEGLVTQVVSASEEVASSATELNSAAAQLATTTTVQSTSVTETSGTIEDLARASASIAETVDEVAAQAAETRNNLEQAEGDLGRRDRRGHSGRDERHGHVDGKGSQADAGRLGPALGGDRWS